MMRALGTPQAVLPGIADATAPLSLTFGIDSLSLLLLGLVIVATFSIAAFSWSYFGGDTPKSASIRRSFFGYLALFQMVCVGIFFAADWLTFLIFVELATVPLSLLIAQSKKRIAIMYMVVQLGGASFILMGVASLHARGLPLDLGPVPADVAPLFLLGLGIKSAFLGLHFWLPEAHSKASTPASALLSGLAVKIGIYGIIRLSSGGISPFLLAMGTAMALWGALQGMRQWNAKRLLAYSTVSQLGYMLAAIGGATSMAMAGATAHMVVHAMLKGLLFLVVGAMIKSLGSPDLKTLSNAHTPTPSLPLKILFVVAALGIMGLPGTVGFWSKGFIKEALSQQGLWAVGLLLMVANVGTVAALTKLGLLGFFLRRRKPGVAASPTKATPEIAAMGGKLSPILIGSMVPLALTIPLLGVMPNLLTSLMDTTGPSLMALLTMGSLLSTLGVFVAGGLVSLIVIRPPKGGFKVAGLLHSFHSFLKLCQGMLSTLQRWHSGKVRHHLLEILVVVVLILLAIHGF